MWSLADAQTAQVPDSAKPPTGNAPAPGEIVVEGQIGPPKSDPFEAINEESYRLTQAADRALVKPLANVYYATLPEPVRDGVGNVIRNLGEPSNALNFLLQGKVGKAFETLGRMAINTTVGVGGLFDVAGKRMNLPYYRNGFGNTMGYYGIGPGPYLFLPVTGPTSVRDGIGLTLDQSLLPFAVGKPFNRPTYTIPYFILNAMQQRVTFDREIAAIRESDDPYRLRRESYLAQRRRDIAALKGEPISEQDQRWLDELEAMKAAATPDIERAPAPAPAQEPEAPAATPVEPPANPEAVTITQPD